MVPEERAWIGRCRLATHSGGMSWSSFFRTLSVREASRRETEADVQGLPRLWLQADALFQGEGERGFLLKDAEHRWLAANRTARMWLGVERPDWKGHTCRELLCNNSLADEVMAADDKLLADGIPVESEVTVADTHGVERLLRIRRGRYLDDANKPYVMVQMRDHTAIRRAELDLQRSRERLALVQQATGMGVWDWDVPNDQMRWDHYMHHMYNVDPQAYTGDYAAWRRTILPEDSDRFDEMFSRALEVAGVSSFEGQSRISGPH